MNKNSLHSDIGLQRVLSLHGMGTDFALRQEGVTAMNQNQLLSRSSAAPEYTEPQTKKAFAIFYRFQNKWHRCFGYEMLPSGTNFKEYIEKIEPDEQDVPDFALKTGADIRVKYAVGYAEISEGIVEEFEEEETKEYIVWKRFDFKRWPCIVQ